MKSAASALAIAMIPGLLYLLAPGTSPAKDARRGSRAFQATQGLEVVNGSYSCDGSVFTDGQPAHIRTGAFMTATSGITSGFSGASQSSVEVPADLDAMTQTCQAHITEVVAQVPAICALGPVRSERGAFGNGEEAGVRFDFSCQGTRDEVIDVIGGFSRVALAAELG